MKQFILEVVAGAFGFLLLAVIGTAFLIWLEMVINGS